MHVHSDVAANCIALPHCIAPQTFSAAAAVAAAHRPGSTSEVKSQGSFLSFLFAAPEQPQVWRWRQWVDQWCRGSSELERNGDGAGQLWTRGRWRVFGQAQKAMQSVVEAWGEVGLKGITRGRRGMCRTLGGSPARDGERVVDRNGIQTHGECCSGLERVPPDGKWEEQIFDIFGQL